MAEEFPRSGELEQAFGNFQKTLETDQENVAIKVRLAEVFNLSEEEGRSLVAVHYELAAAYESAQNRGEALQVCGINI